MPRRPTFMWIYPRAARRNLAPCPPRFPSPTRRTPCPRGKRLAGAAGNAAGPRRAKPGPPGGGARRRGGMRPPYRARTTPPGAHASPYGRARSAGRPARERCGVEASPYRNATAPCRIGPVPCRIVAAPCRIVPIRDGSGLEAAYFQRFAQNRRLGRAGPAEPRHGLLPGRPPAISRPAPGGDVGLFHRSDQHHPWPCSAGMTPPFPGTCRV